MHTEGHDMGKPEGLPEHPSPKFDAEHPGYELEDVNVGGTVTFLGGLVGFVAIFFIFCYFMGKGINYFMQKSDGPTGKFQTNLSQPGMGKPANLQSNAVTEQKQLQQMTTVFPTPRLQTDDGNQDTADLHAREDLLLDYTSTSGDLPAGTVRIPIDQAMKLVVQRGLPKAASTAASDKRMAGEAAPTVGTPLTTGFARTGYELQVIAAREQKMDFEKAETAKK